MVISITRYGETIYNHIAYATDSVGTGLSLTETDDALYIGRYESKTATESTDPNDYVWLAMVKDIEETETDDETIIAINDAIDYASQVAETYITPAEPDYEETGNNGYVGTLDASNVNVINLNASNITAGTISSDRLNTNEIVSNVITTGQFDTKYASMQNANISNLVAGNIDASQINISNINGHAITNSSLIAKALSSDVIETALGCAVFYISDVSELPTVREDGTSLQSGDLAYLTINDPDAGDGVIDNIYEYNGTSWNITHENVESIIRSNSITSQEIATNTITANNIETDYVYTNEIKAEQVYFGSTSNPEPMVDIIEDLNKAIDKASQTATAYMTFSPDKGLTIGENLGITVARLKNDQLGFYGENTLPLAYIGKDDAGIWAFSFDRGVVNDNLKFGQFGWIKRDNNNMSLKWLG